MSMSISDIKALACADCPAEVNVIPSVSGVTGRPLGVVSVIHADSCPWAARYVGAPLAIVARPEGILIHFRTGTDDIDALMSTVDHEPSAAGDTTGQSGDGPESTPDKAA
ncbi:hypothetical protein [Micromonospora sp. S4605]|uniref:hypothetical protein n=1 Tax=Micromonospora sp. S4605 TaxID=1420897 RepID=UPI0013053883|nr:hypothetical protein [Micromonospora sp. S4605]